MKTFGLLAATALLIPSVPSGPAMAQSPRWDDYFCDYFGGIVICYFETRAQCEYTRAKLRNADREIGLRVEQCDLGDDPRDLGLDWQFVGFYF